MFRASLSAFSSLSVSNGQPASIRLNPLPLAMGYYNIAKRLPGFGYSRRRSSRVARSNSRAGTRLQSLPWRGGPRSGRRRSVAAEVEPNVAATVVGPLKMPWGRTRHPRFTAATSRNRPRLGIHRHRRQKIKENSGQAVDFTDKLPWYDKERIRFLRPAVARQGAASGVNWSIVDKKPTKLRYVCSTDKLLPWVGPIGRQMSQPHGRGPFCVVEFVQNSTPTS